MVNCPLSIVDDGGVVVFQGNADREETMGARSKSLIQLSPAAGDLDSASTPSGEARLVVDGEHFRKIVVEGICAARVSVDIATADFKAMLVPRASVTGSGAGAGRSWRRKADSIVAIFRKLADKGVEIRLMHAGVPSAAALMELRKALPENLIIRRCPRLHAKTVIIDARAMYLGSANLTGAGLGAKADGRRNFEWGVWTDSAGMIEGVLDQFNALWEGQRCRGCKRREVCPVPLEEPGSMSNGKCQKSNVEARS